MKQWVYVCMLLAAAATVACGAEGEMGLGVKLGSLGIGVDYTIGVNEKLNVRVVGNFFSYTYDDFEFDEDDEDEPAIDEVGDEIEVTLDLMSLGAIADWHPWANGFRLSAGAFYNGNEVDLSVTSDQEVEIDEVDYDISRLDGKISFGAFAPYVGIGWGNAAEADQRWSFVFDLGLMLQGSADITLTATTSDPALQNQLNAAIDNEIEDLEDDVEDYTVYPVLALGASYTF
jgi:hypothetical protein